MKYKILVGFIIILLLSNIYFFLNFYKKKKHASIKYETSLVQPNYNNNSKEFTYAVPSYEIISEMKKVKTNAQYLKSYALQNNCNLNYAFVLDMRIPSYKKRFFVYNLKNDSIINSGLVAHGTGSETFKGQLVFSNTPDSRCTSLGKYKIGISYKGIYGFSYKLQGLDSTNNKAFERAIVLHGHNCVPNNEINNFPICFSYGCPMVSTKFLQTLKLYIAKQGKTPILLSIIY
ncbi:MAG: hypothetical protein HOO89_05565 [Ferruginibacter sp.]|nr:hypothetical protein [Ferruginibacter sp.]